MLRALLAATLALLVLSGCAAPKDAGTPMTGSLTAPAEPAQAGAGAASATATAANGTAPAKPQPSTETYEGVWAGGFYVKGTPDGELNGKRPYALSLDGTEAGVVVEMKWTASTPASESMGLVFRKDLKDDKGTAGTGPLRVALTGLEAGDYVAYARASGPSDAAGAFVQQEYTIWITVFPAGSAFDPDYTAMA
ncbi:MAG: hypothetical protein ABR586_03165 [Thermoplasmatota archaeon]